MTKLPANLSSNPKIVRIPRPDCHSQLLEQLQTSAQNLWRVPEATKRRRSQGNGSGFFQMGAEAGSPCETSTIPCQFDKNLGIYNGIFYAVPAFSGHSTSWGTWNVIFYHSTSGLRGYLLVIKHGWKIPYVQLIFPMSSHIFLWFSHVFIGFPSQTPRPSHCWEPTAAAHCGASVLPRGPRRRLWPGEFHGMSVDIWLIYGEHTINIVSYTINNG
jgi:hypothetical protein